MNQSTRPILFFTLAVIFLLSACLPAAQPTQSPEEIENQIATSVALTVAAQNAETQAALSLTPEVTNTTLPTQTEAVLASPTAVLPTATSVVLPTTAPAGGGGGTTTKPDYACNPFPRTPRDNTVFRPNATFDIRWTIVNTGTKNMRAGLDLKYNTGTQLTTITFIELPELEPGDEYEVVMDAVAPKKEGNYIMTFFVEGGLCYPYTAIVVDK